MQKLPSVTISKRYQTLITSVAIVILLRFAGMPDEQTLELQKLVLGLSGLLIGGYSVQDSISTWNGDNKYNRDTPVVSSED